MPKKKTKNNSYPLEQEETVVKGSLFLFLLSNKQPSYV